MKIDLSQDDPVIDATDLGQHLGLPPEQVMALLRDGTITSRYEIGAGADAGNHRLTFWHDGNKVRFTCDADGSVIKTSRVTAGGKR